MKRPEWKDTTSYARGGDRTPSIWSINLTRDIRIARVPDMEAALIAQDAEIERLTARAEAAEALLAAATGMVSIVEGMDGAMNHGVWRDEGGMRLKDTPEWVSLYNAHAAMKEGR